MLNDPRFITQCRVTLTPNVTKLPQGEWHELCVEIVCTDGSTQQYRRQFPNDDFLSRFDLLLKEAGRILRNQIEQDRLEIPDAESLA